MSERKGKTRWFYLCVEYGKAKILTELKQNKPWNYDCRIEAVTKRERTVGVKKKGKSAYQWSLVKDIECFLVVWYKCEWIYSPKSYTTL